MAKQNKSKFDNVGKKKRSQKKINIEHDKSDSYESSTNDWRWYAMNEQLLKDTATIPFTWPLGRKLGTASGLPSKLGDNSIPGIMVLNCVPTFGNSKDDSSAEVSPINIAARNFYSYIRHKNSGARNYDSPDLMLYLCAMDNIYSFISWCQRLYGICRVYSYENYYYPKHLVSSLHVDFDDLIANLADFRSWVNTIIVRASSFCVPNSMSYMARHSWMYSGYYTDSEAVQSQTYIFDPLGFWRYDLDDDGAGCLKWLNFNEAKNTTTGLKDFKHIRQYGETLLGSVMGVEDIAIMSGDILKALDYAGIVQLYTIGEEYNVVPTYDETVLSQIQNATMVGEPTWNTGYIGLSQKTGVGEGQLITDLRFMINRSPIAESGIGVLTPLASTNPIPGLSYLTDSRILTLRSNNPQPQDIMEATRLTNIADDLQWDSAKSAHTYSIPTLGADAVAYATIYSISTDLDIVDNKPEWIVNPWKYPTTNKTDEILLSEFRYHNVLWILQTLFKDNTSLHMSKNMPKLASFLRVVSQYTNFDWAPICSITGMTIENATTDDSTVKITYSPISSIFGDVDNTTVVTQHNLENMSLVAMLSMFSLSAHNGDNTYYSIRFK